MFLKEKYLDKKVAILTVMDKKNVLPTLQINIYKKKDIMVGKCLDFNFICSSENVEKLDLAMQEIAKKMRDISTLNIIKHLEKNTIDYLYENAIKIDNQDWEFYLSSQRKRRIQIIKENLLINFSEQNGISPYYYSKFKYEKVA